MNRPIKFRAWVEKLNIWAYFDLGRLARDLKMQRHVSESKAVVESTGLLDKNGKEIYEGDVVKDGPYSFKVIWDKYCWNLEGFHCAYFDYPGLAFSEYDFSDKASVFEVIGNIYENPELLKV